MIAEISKYTKHVRTLLKLCLSISMTTVLMILPADAHGTSSGSESGGLALLIFPLAAILFVLFLVFSSCF